MRCGAAWPRRGGGITCPRTAARLSPHLLRHFAASDPYRDRMNVVAIQEVLGHQWAENHDDLRACRQGPTSNRSGPPPVAGPLTGSEADDDELESADGRRGSVMSGRRRNLHAMLADAGLVISAGKMSRSRAHPASHGRRAAHRPRLNGR